MHQMAEAVPEDHTIFRVRLLITLGVVAAGARVLPGQRRPLVAVASAPATQGTLAHHLDWRPQLILAVAVAADGTMVQGTEQPVALE